MNKIDLHVHTTMSDGTKTPKEVLVEAEKMGLEVIAITDHESVDAYPEIEKNRNLFSGTIIPGIELKTVCMGKEIELLGYGISIDKMKEKISKLYKSKEEINRGYLHAIVKVLRANDIILPDDIEERYNNITGTQPAWYVRDEMNKAAAEHNKDVLYNKDRIEHGPKEGIYRGWFTNPESKFYVKYSAYPSYQEVIELIKECDGKVFIPHIYQYKEYSEKILKELLNTGEITGIECFYPTFTKEQTDYLLNICNENNFAISGGSDYHGENKVNRLGTGIDNNLYVPSECVEEWINKESNVLKKIK